jgi:hypothetical protein
MITSRDFLLKLHTTYFGDCLNVFYYQCEQPHDIGDAANLAAAFNEDVVPAIANIMNSFVGINQIEVINLGDPTDFHVLETTAIAGSVASTSQAPPFTAYSFQLARSTRSGRHGYKRFAGVAEEYADAKGPGISGPLVAAIPQVVFRLSGFISNATRTYVPMIPHRERVEDINHVFHYQLVSLLPISNVVYQGLTTQNTRKR